MRFGSVRMINHGKAKETMLVSASGCIVHSKYSHYSGCVSRAILYCHLKRSTREANLSAMALACIKTLIHLMVSSIQQAAFHAIPPKIISAKLQLIHPTH